MSREEFIADINIACNLDDVSANAAYVRVLAEYDRMATRIEELKTENAELRNDLKKV